jgi:hypothetical protein
MRHEGTQRCASIRSEHYSVAANKTHRRRSSQDMLGQLFSLFLIHDSACLRKGLPEHNTIALQKSQARQHTAKRDNLKTFPESRDINVTTWSINIGNFESNSAE